MRWNKKSKFFVKKFAFFPIEIRGEYRWLETVYLQQEPYRGGFTGDIYWEPIRFMTKEEYYEKVKRKD